jgi:phage replication-related protein YjqB (UPF0714/DUF867 family)
MATYQATVKKVFSSQLTLIGKGEHCSADPTRLATIGRARGHQIRVKRSDEYALFTVSEVRAEAPDAVVRMAQAGRERLGANDEFSALIDAQVPHPTLNDAQAKAGDEFVERLSDDAAQNALIVIAPHGGAIEHHTDRQAERVTTLLSPRPITCWTCKGWRKGGGASQRWHITSADIHEASFPLLAQVVDRHFTYAIAFHGFSELDILIGGRAPQPLKEEIKAALEGVLSDSGIDVRIADPGEEYSGDDPRNIVNRLSPNAIQIEQSSEGRRDYWQPIADAIAAVYAARL